MENDGNSQILKQMIAKTVTLQVCQRYQYGVLEPTKFCASGGPGYNTCRVSDTFVTIFKKLNEISLVDLI